MYIYIYIQFYPVSSYPNYPNYHPYIHITFISGWWFGNPPEMACEMGQSSSCWWFGTMEFYDFPHIGNVNFPTDEVIFFRGG